MTDEPQKLSQMLEKLHELGKEKDRLSRELKDAERDFKQYQDKCIVMMERENVSSQKSGGVQFVKSATVFAQVQDREEFIRWAEENDPTLTESRERKAILNALVREHIDNGEPLPPGVGHYEREVIRRSETA